MSDGLVITLEGNIHEDFEFPAVNDIPAKVVIDLAKVKSINSLGIREWINWIRPISEKAAISLRNCQKAIVMQFSMVDGFIPQNATIESFYVPFFCDACDEGKDLLFKMGTDIVVADGDYSIKLDLKTAAKCEKCGQEMQMDVSEKKYFQFLKRKA